MHQPTRRDRRYGVLALGLAAVLTLGGTGVTSAADDSGAGKKKPSVTGKQVKNGSLTGKDVRDRSLTNRDVAPGVLPPGAAGRPGPSGAPGASGLFLDGPGGPG